MKMGMNMHGKMAGSIVVMAVAAFGATLFLYGNSAAAQSRQKGVKDLVDDTLVKVSTRLGLASVARAVEHQRFLDGVRPYDEARMKDDLTEAELTSMSTARAFNAFTGKSFTVVMDYHIDNTGVERLLRVSKSLNTLINRKDFPAAMLELMREDILDPDDVKNPEQYVTKAILDLNQEAYKKGALKKIPESKYMAMGFLTTNYRYRNTLLLYPDILKKLKGYEASLIRELGRQHLKMLAVDSAYKEKFGEYNGVHGINVIITFNLAQALIKQMDKTVLDGINPDQLSRISMPEMKSFYQQVNERIALAPGQRQ